MTTTLIRTLEYISRIYVLAGDSVKKEIQALELAIFQREVEHLTVTVNAEHEALMKGQKISAIKAYRERTGKGLMESKIFIEKLINDHPTYLNAYNANNNRPD